MTTVERTLGDPRRTASAGRAGTFVDRARSLPARIRASEYVRVGGGRRFIAVQRRRTRTASRIGFIVIAVAVAYDAVALLGLPIEHVQVALAINALTILMALGGWWLLPRMLRRSPEPLAWAVAMGLSISTAATGIAVPDLAVETAGYLLVLPGLIALVLPWSTRTHVRWLLAYAFVAFGYLAFAPPTALAPSERGDLVIVLLAAMGASLAGHILLQRSQIRSFAQLEKIRALRRQADADMLELVRVHDELEMTARTDPLTGAGNRRRLEEDFRAVRAHVGRSGFTYGLAVIDLDRFKAINDRLGHVAGDAVLQRVVAAIQRALRAEDAVYRLGGEEFLVLLHVSTRESVETAAERLRAVVAELGIDHPGNPPHRVVSISIGTTLVGPADLPLEPEAWLARADTALYAAKSRGRNRVTFLPGPEFED